MPARYTRLAVEIGFIEGAISYMPSNFDHLDFIAGVRYIFINTQFVLTPDQHWNQITTLLIH